MPANEPYTKEEKKVRFIPNISENEEKELLIQKYRDLNNQNEKRKEEQIKNNYYRQNYLEMLRKK